MVTPAAAVAVALTAAVAAGCGTSLSAEERQRIALDEATAYTDAYSPFGKITECRWVDPQPTSASESSRYTCRVKVPEGAGSPFPGEEAADWYCFHIPRADFAGPADRGTEFLGPDPGPGFRGCLDYTRAD
ncbi:MAG: hypothetical protein ACKVUT_07275 [Gaiella sp.]